MTWEVFITQHSKRAGEPNWAWEGWISNVDVYNSDCQLLKAFADELVKRMDEDIVVVYGVPDTLPPSIINQLLTEAGVER